jgi:hypothetical protein
MLFNVAFLSTILLSALAAALPVDLSAELPDLKDQIGENGEGTSKATVTLSDTYKVYSGDGTKSASWPNKDSWGTYDQLWKQNLPLIRQSCTWNKWGEDNSETEISDINKAIQKVSNETQVDSRIILAVMMQESKGCVRVPTSYNPIKNPGLMQSHNGKGSCDGVAKCSAATIELMIRDGVVGTSNGDGLKQCFAKTLKTIGSAGSRALYAAARMYNSGSVDYENFSNGFSSTKCYVSDIANRLTGWTLAKSKCR